MSIDSFIPEVVKSLRIAVVQPVSLPPVLTVPLRSFYAFYAKYKGVTTNVTTDSTCSATDVSSGLGFKQGWG